TAGATNVRRMPGGSSLSTTLIPPAAQSAPFIPLWRWMPAIPSISGSPLGLGYHPGDVRTDGAGRGAAGDHDAPRGRAVRVGGRVRAGRIPARDRRSGGHGPLPRAPDLQGDRRVSLDEGAQRGDRGRRRLVQRG